MIHHVPHVDPIVGRGPRGRPNWDDVLLVNIKIKMEKDNYEDIINLPHHESKTHPHMSLYNRAAQFSPFAALTGYEDAIKEAQRKQEEKIRKRNNQE